MDRPAPSILKAALIGGVAAGVASSIPIVEFLNCACCALVIGGGVLAAGLQSRASKTAGVPFRVGNGAVVGLVAGLVYGVTSGVLAALVAAVFGNPTAEVLKMVEGMGAEIPPETIEMLESMSSASPAMVGLMSVVVGVIVGAIFSTLGGVIGGAAFKYEPAPPAPPTQGMAPPPPAAE